MKKLLIPIIALLPLLSFAGNGDGDKKTKQIDIRITTDRNGKVKVKSVNKNLQGLEKDLNEALENVTVKIDGKEKHEIHFKAELKID
jgi:hypothetical protein